MDDQRIGALFRAIRQKHGWRQADVAAKADVSRSTISRVERGHFDQLSLELVRRVARVLEVRLDLAPRWRGGDLDRLLNSRHAAMHESVARSFGDRGGWETRHEVSFAVYAERGVVDILAWHPARRALLIIELKTELTDVNDLMAQASRRTRLAREIVREFGWEPVVIGYWVVVQESRTNRRRVADHGIVLRSTFPAGARDLDAWLRNPAAPLAGLSFWEVAPPAGPGIRKLRIRAPRP